MTEKVSKLLFQQPVRVRLRIAFPTALKNPWMLDRRYAPAILVIIDNLEDV